MFLSFRGLYRQTFIRNPGKALTAHTRLHPEPPGNGEGKASPVTACSWVGRSTSSFLSKRILLGNERSEAFVMWVVLQGTQDDVGPMSSTAVFVENGKWVNFYIHRGNPGQSMGSNLVKEFPLRGTPLPPSLHLESSFSPSGTRGAMSQPLGRPPCVPLLAGALVSTLPGTQPPRPPLYFILLPFFFSVAKLRIA